MELAATAHGADGSYSRPRPRYRREHTAGPDDVAYRRPRHAGISLRRARPAVLGAIWLGGALGSAARHGLAQLLPFRDGFPWATFWANIAGSLALGLVLTLILERFPPSRYLRPFVATGFLGAFTTYSAFAVETDRLARQGRVGLGVLYAAGSLVAGYLAVWVGMRFARALPHPLGGKR
jgi:CrcB protein